MTQWRMNRRERRKLEAVRRDKPVILAVMKLEDYAGVRNFRVPDTVTTLEDMMRTTSLMVEREFEQVGGLDPFWLVDGSEGLVVIEPNYHLTVTGEDYLITALRELFRIQYVHRFVCAMEAWGTRTGAQQPSEAPDRRDVVLIHGEDGTRMLNAVRDIVRADDGKPHLTALKINESAAHGGGPFTDLLPKRSDGSECVH